MKKQRNELLELLGGLAMLAVGLFWFSTSVTVSNSFFTHGVHIGFANVPSGLVIVPFIIAVVLVFIRPESFARKLFLALSVLLIITSIIASTRLYLSSMTLFEWAGILILIFGGLALICKVLFKPVKKSGED